MWSPTKLGFLFYDFWFTIFFKDSIEIKKKDKTIIENHFKGLFDQF
jgi:hypothetical protein